MDVTPLVKAGQQIIQSYAGGQFAVSGQRYDTPIIVTPGQTTAWETQGNVAAFEPGDFEALFAQAGEVDVVLLGCGKSMTFLPPELRNFLKEKGFSVDVMDTGAACRTYNVLMAEGRRVAAALLPVS